MPVPEQTKHINPYARVYMALCATYGQREEEPDGRIRWEFGNNLVLSYSPQKPDHRFAVISYGSVLGEFDCDLEYVEGLRDDS